jgi:hypothetical protein
MRLLILLSFLIYLALPLQSIGQTNLVGVPSLRIEPDPISTGRGFTGVARADRVTAIYWNPAGLAFQRGSQIGISRFNWSPEMNDDYSFNYLMGRHYIDGIGTLGADVRYLGLGNGRFVDGNENINDSFSSYEFSVGVSLGRVAIPQTLSLGIGLRYVSSHLLPSGIDLGDGETSKVGNAFTFDLGGLYFPGNFMIGHSTVRPTVGFSLSNFGGKIQYSSSGMKNPLPTTLRIGAAAKVSLDRDGINTLTPSIEFSKMMVRVDSTGADGAFQSLFSSWGGYEYFNGQETIDVGLGKQLMYGVGLEYWYANMLALRGGYYNQSESNGGRKFITFGGSIKYNPIEINASYALQQGQAATGNIFRIGLLFNL